jgi:hypothetical protein
MYSRTFNDALDPLTAYWARDELAEVISVICNGSLAASKLLL